jgi:hypothetical protein
MRKTFAALFVVLLLAGCNNKKASDKESTTDKKESADNKLTSSSQHNVILFTVNGEKVTSSGWNISRFNFGNGAGNSVNLTSNMHEQPKTINININGDRPGVYPLQSGLGTLKTPGVAYGSYTPDYMNGIGNHFSFKDGEFEIISIDTVAGSLNAKFHGTAKNMKGESVTITDGQVIDGKLKTGVTQQIN